MPFHAFDMTWICWHPNLRMVGTATSICCLFADSLHMSENSVVGGLCCLTDIFDIDLFHVWHTKFISKMRRLSLHKENIRPQLDDEILDWRIITLAKSYIIVTVSMRALRRKDKYDIIDLPKKLIRKNAIYRIVNMPTQQNFRQMNETLNSLVHN